MCSLFSVFLLFFILLSKTVLARNDVLVTHANGSSVELYSLYSTIGNFIETPISNLPVTILYKNNVSCTINLPSSQLTNHFLVFAHSPFENYLFKKCTNYFFDSYGGGAFFARLAEDVGAAGILTIGSGAEKQFSNYRVTGFNNKIKMPFLVTTKETMQYFTDNSATITSIQLPAISSHDKSFIESLQHSFRALNIANSILWPILTVLTAYFALVDIIVYFRTPKNRRTTHPILTKAAPCLSALFASIWHITDPFSYELKVHFPATFFEGFHFGFLYVTCCLLLKTWILAVGDKLKSPMIFRISIISVTIFTAIDIIMSFVWVFGGPSFLTVEIVFGGITAVICGTGYIYYGKDIVLILSKGGTNGSYRHLSVKIIIFTVIFVVFVYTFVILYVAEVIGSSLSEFMLQIALSFAFILIYAILFFRKIKTETNNEDSGGKGSKGSKGSKESKESRTPTPTNSSKITTIVQV